MHVSPRCGIYYFAPTVIAWALDYCISLVQFFRGGGGSESAFMSHSRKSKSPCVPTATVLTKRVGWVVMEPPARFFTPPRTKVGTRSLAFVKTHCRRTSPPPPFLSVPRPSKDCPSSNFEYFHRVFGERNDYEFRSYAATNESSA